MGVHYICTYSKGKEIEALEPGKGGGEKGVCIVKTN